MSRRKRDVAMIVTVRVPADVGRRAAEGQVRLALANGFELNSAHVTARLVSVAPIPADRMIKPRKKRERRKVPGLLAAMGITR